MMPDKKLSELLAELMDAEGVSPEKLSALTNIPTRFIVSLKEGELDKLPAEPYVRGYLKKIADALKTDEEALINAYKESKRIAKVGATDTLPSNQYARVPMKKSWLLVPIILIAFSVMFYVRQNQIFGIPELTLDVPSVVYAESLLVEGNIRPGDKITLNGELLPTDKTGHFEETIFLRPGLNTLEFKVSRFLGKETIVVKEVYYEEAAIAPAPLPSPVR